MKIMAWNCRGLGGSFTISQLKESIRLHLPDIIFISETKQKKGFVHTVSKRLKWKGRWDVVDPVGRSGGLLVVWGEKVSICRIIKSDFCIELEIECEGVEGRMWIIFIYASAIDQVRREQWEILKVKRDSWGKKWIMGGDFN